MFCEALSSVVIGIQGMLIRVEADVSSGLPYFDLVGYLSGEVKEARERVKAAIRNAGICLEPKRVVVNLSPADVRKSGTSYDLAIAVSVLGAYGFVKTEALKDIVLIGELGLDGSVRGVRGVLPIVLDAMKSGVKSCIVPMANASEGAAVHGIDVYGVSHLVELISYLNGQTALEPVKADENGCIEDIDPFPDFSDIRGQESLKRSFEIAAAGMHHLMLIGPAGTGKSMAARRLPLILPSLSYDEQLEISAIYSVAGLLKEGGGLVKQRPFRSPHHTVTETALAGGGRIPMPGEVSLAHGGVLFLDEMTEFHSQAMEVLRQPLENGEITINRAQQSCTFPADFMLVAAMNPCACGFYPDPVKCRCSPLQIRRYIGRISRPLFDRFDLMTQVMPVKSLSLKKPVSDQGSSRIMKARVTAAHDIQKIRYAGTGYRSNAQLRDQDIERFCRLDAEGQGFMVNAYKKYDLSARSYYKILKVARTIADLEGEEDISLAHLEEAVFYKTIDQKFWGDFI